jgi:hypothetical protein
MYHSPRNGRQANSVSYTPRKSRRESPEEQWRNTYQMRSRQIAIPQVRFGSCDGELFRRNRFAGVPMALGRHQFHQFGHTLHQSRVALSDRMSVREHGTLIQVRGRTPRAHFAQLFGDRGRILVVPDQCIAPDHVPIAESQRQESNRT